jgi:hypothetical protein
VEVALRCCTAGRHRMVGSTERRGGPFHWCHRGGRRTSGSARRKRCHQPAGGARRSGRARSVLCVWGLYRNCSNYPLFGHPDALESPSVVCIRDGDASAGKVISAARRCGGRVAALSKVQGGNASLLLFPGGGRGRLGCGCTKSANAGAMSTSDRNSVILIDRIGLV